MDRERAETHLRLLAEAELRRAMTMPAGSIPGRWYSARLALVAQALTAVGAVGANVAYEIQAGLGLAVAARHQLPARIPGPGRTQPAPRRTSWRVAPAGQVVNILCGGVRREVPFVAYAQSLGGARFVVTEWPFGPFTFTAADDRGICYQISWAGEMAPRELRLRPDPPHQVRWLDLTAAAGEPATRIDLDPQNSEPVPDVTVTQVSSCWTPSPPGSSPPRRRSRRTTPHSRPPPVPSCAPSATGPAKSSPRCTRPACCRRTAPSPDSSPGYAPGSASAATVSPRRPPGTWQNGGTAC